MITAEQIWLFVPRTYIQSRVVITRSKISWHYIQRCNYKSRIKVKCWTHKIHPTVYPKKYAHGFVVLCFVVVMQSFIMNSHEVFIHIHQGCFAGTGAIVRLPQCQWSKPVGYGKISQCITTTKHSKAKSVCIFLGIYCMSHSGVRAIGCLLGGSSRKSPRYNSTALYKYSNLAKLLCFCFQCSRSPQ